MATSADAPIVGMIGGGQLARMTAAPAAALGLGFRVLAASDQEPAAQIVRDLRIGSHHVLEDLLAFADGCAVVTFDHEHVPPEHLLALEGRGVPVRPGPSALIAAQDKLLMRRMLAEHAIPCPRWAQVADAAEACAFAAEVGWPIVLKASRGGYDGRGVWIARDAAQVQAAMQVPLGVGAAWLAEEHVPFVQELSAQVARSPSGQAATYPVVRTVQQDGMCSVVIAPCPGLDDERSVQAASIALRVAEALGVTGMLAVELFDTGEAILVNELAMRPHNSGHWTIEGAVTSQFENHLRAVLDLPLGSTRARAPFAVMSNIVGTDAGNLVGAYRHVLARDPEVKVHLYGKEPRPGRKLGHVTILGRDHEELLARAQHAADYLSGRIDE